MIGLFALVTAAVFFGAAVYVSVAEHPARLTLADSAALAQWAPSYKLGSVMQASLAILSGLLGIGAWWQSGDALWALGAIAVLANWPYTLVAIMPINHRLQAIPSDLASSDTRMLLVRWGHLHAGRSALGGSATAIYLLAAVPGV
jgi:hypothetical protein